jgi:hypothetical protein
MSFGRRAPVGYGGPERRSAPRVKLELSGQILVPGHFSRACRVIDRSMAGARLAVTSVFGIPVSFELRVAGQTVRATVVRKQSGRLHVKFC